MNVPIMYYVGLISNLVFLFFGIFGYFYILRKTARKYLFLILFAGAWLFSGLSYTFLISGASADQWYITLIRIVSYVFFLGTFVSLTVELSRLRKAA